MVSSGLAHLRFGPGADNGGVVLEGVLPSTAHSIIDAARPLPFVIVGTDPSHADLADLVVSEDRDIDEIRHSLSRAPLACATLATLLRGVESRSVEDSLVAESAAYSLLQGGPEFSAWRVANKAKPRTEEQEVLLVAELNAEIMMTFNRPHKHNAFNTALQTQFVDALTAAVAADNTKVIVNGNGRSFCSGGDLDEFGDRPDTATSHAVRLTRSAGRLLCQLGDRVEFHIHGACMGAGIELPAFAPTVIAREDTRIALPEITIGLIPGAGGTASLPRRIGRHRTALLGLTARTIDAPTAQAWGLIDRIV